MFSADVVPFPLFRRAFLFCTGGEVVRILSFFFSGKVEGRGRRGGGIKGEGGGAYGEGGGDEGGEGKGGMGWKKERMVVERELEELRREKEESLGGGEEGGSEGVVAGSGGNWKRGEERNGEVGEEVFGVGRGKEEEMGL